jgi:hypothetical protein
MHNKSVNRTVKKLCFLPSGYVQRWALNEKSHDFWEWYVIEDG